MKTSRIKSLVMVDLLTSVRQMSNDKKEKITKKNIYRRVIFQNLTMIFIMPLLFSAFLVGYPLNEAPGTTTYLIFSVLGMAFFQLFIVTYNLLYQEQDFSNYLALPFTKSEFLISKLMTVLVSSAGFTVPVAVFIGLFAYQSKASLIFGILFAIFSYILVTLALLEFIIIILSFMTKMKWFQRYEKYIMLLFNILMIAVIFYISFTMEMSSYDATTKAQAALSDREPIKVLLPFLQVFTKDAMIGWLGVVGWIVAGILMFVYIKQRVVPTLFSEKAPREKAKSRKRKMEKGRRVYPELKQILRTYHFKLMEDTTLLLMMLFGKVYFPIIFFIPVFMDGAADLTKIPVDNTLGVYVLVGMVGAYLTTGPASLASIGISLEKENLYYIKTLPFSFSKYMRNKFRFAFSIEWISGLLIYLVPALIMGVSPWIALSFALGYTFAIYLYSAYYFKRDWKNLSLNWSTINELFSRGGNQALYTFLSIFIMFILMGIGAVIILAINALSPNWQLFASIVIVVLAAASVYWMYRHMEENFWPIFDGKLEGSEELLDISDRTSSMSRKEQKEHFGWLSFPRRKFNWKDYVWMFLTGNLFLQMVATNVYAIFNYDAIRSGGPEALWIPMAKLTAWSTVASIPLMLLVVYWRKIPLFNRKRLSRKDSVLIPGLTKKDWKFLALYIPISFVLYQGGQIFLDTWLGRNNPINQQGVEKVAEVIPLWLLFLMIVVAAPIVEELFFRGMLMFRNPKKAPGWGATIFSALVFGLIHTPTDIQSFYTYVGMGLVFSYAAKKTNSVEAAMIYHALNNLIGFLAIVYGAV